MEEIEAAWTKIPEFARVSLSFASPGEDLADFEACVEDATEPGILTSNGPSPSQKIVLGTVAFGVHCLFRGHIKGVEDKPRIVLATKVILEKKSRYMFPGGQEDQEPTSRSDQHTSQPEDGRDP